MTVHYDRRLGMARFTGPGGFTQAFMDEDKARAIAQAFGIPFELEGQST